MIGTKVHEREFNPAGYALAAICAPALSVIIVLVCAFLAAAVDGEFGAAGPLEMIGMSLFIILICTLWGFVPALAFGALVLVPFELFRRGRHPPRWAFAAAGLLAAVAYVLVSLSVERMIGSGVYVLAPWAAPMRDDQPYEGIALVYGAIVLAGGGAGLIYERFSRVVHRPGAWRPDGGASEQPAAIDTDDKRG